MLKLLPNFITVSRILLSFLFIPIFLRNDFVLSLIIFSAASISDFFDGYIARKFKITSKFGAIMDPVADKVLMFISYWLFAYTKIIPWYLAVIVILRDLLIITVVAACLVKKINLKFSPLMSSKINTAIQLSFAVLVLACKALAVSPSLDTFVLIVCCMTIYSGLDYARRYKWIKNELYS